MLVAGSPDLVSNMTALNVVEQSYSIKYEKSDGSGCVNIIIIINASTYCV